MTITHALVILSNSADKISLRTDLPCPFKAAFLPSQPPLELNFDASFDTGIDYIRKHFNIEPEVLNLRVD